LLRDRQADVRSAYERDLDVILNPVANWPSSTTVARTVVAQGPPPRLKH
jgi:hypothetical protein